MLRTTRALIVVTLVFFAKTGVSAQSTPAWGVNAPSVQIVTAWEMNIAENGIASTVDPSNGYRYLSSTGTLLGSLHLQQGAQILAIELEACDIVTNSFD